QDTNQEIIKNYLTLSSLTQLNLFSNHQTNNPISLNKLSTFLFSKLQKISKILKNVKETSIFSLKTVKIELKRYKDFTSTLSLSYLESIDFRFLQNYQKSVDIKKKVEMLKVIVRKVESHLEKIQVLEEISNK